MIHTGHHINLLTDYKSVRSFANCSLNFLGHALRRRNIPIFEDILHYLDYIKLDEPIIGE